VSFSVAKSFVSTLVGIAIDEGLIGGVDGHRGLLEELLGGRGTDTCMGGPGADTIKNCEG